MPSTASGLRTATTVNARAPPTPNSRLMPITWRIPARSWRPQNWAVKIADPLTMPNSSRLSRKKNWFANPTAATGVSPNCPIIRTSVAFSSESANC